MNTVTVNRDSIETDRSSAPLRRIRITAHGDLTKDVRVLELNRVCRDSLNRHVDRLILDASGVTHSDTKLIAVLISLYANCRRSKIELEWRLAPAILEWLSIYDLTWIAEIDAPESAARSLGE